MKIHLFLFFAFISDEEKFNFERNKIAYIKKEDISLQLPYFPSLDRRTRWKQWNCNSRNVPGWVRRITELFPFYVRYISLARKPIWNALIAIESPAMRTRGQKIPGHL